MPSTRQTEPAARGDQSQQNIEAIVRLEEKALHNRTFTERVAERITAAAGSAAFIITHIVLYAAWIILNINVIPDVEPFDPHPFGVLALVVGVETIIVTLLVLINQKRLMRDEDQRSHLELQLNMLAEQEGTETLRLVRMISEHLRVPGAQSGERETAKHLEKPTDVHELAKTIEETRKK